MKTLILPFLILLTCFISCSEVSEDFESTSKNIASYDVYVAGTENNKACYWKNNLKTELIEGDSIVPEKIIVEDNNVYVFGKTKESKPNYYYWKNNVRHSVAQDLNVNPNNNSSTNHFLYINDFQVYNNDVYFLGNEWLYQYPIPNMYDYSYWKNGNKQILRTQLNFTTSSNYLTLYNNDVYATAQLLNGELGFYKNGNYTTLSTGNNLLIKGLNFNANGAFVVINDTNNNTAYYKNLATNTNLYSMLGIPSKVITDGSDIYSTGSSEYFKNGISQSSNTNNDGFTELEDMKVDSQNLYMIKSKSDPNNMYNMSYRVYINGVQTQEILNSASIFNIRNSFNSIFVVAN